MRQLRRHWFLLAIAHAWVLGFCLPEVSRAYQQSALVDVAIAIVMLCGGLSLDTRHLLEQARSGRAILMSIAMMYGVAPALFALAAWPLRAAGSPLAQELAIGVLLLGAQSCTLGSGLVIVTAARANVALALVVTLVNSLASAVLTPLVLSLTLGVRVEVDVAAMIGRLALILLLPVGIGQVVRRLLPRGVSRLRPAASILSQLVVLSMMFMAVGTAAAWMARYPWLVALLVLGVLGLHVLLLAINHALARLVTADEASRWALAICASQKTLATGSYLWSRYFADHALGGVPLMLYHMVQLVWDSLLAQRLAHRLSPLAPLTPARP